MWVDRRLLPCGARAEGSLDAAAGFSRKGDSPPAQKRTCAVAANKGGRAILMPLLLCTNRGPALPQFGLRSTSGSDGTARVKGDLGERPGQVFAAVGRVPPRKRRVSTGGVGHTSTQGDRDCLSLSNGPDGGVGGPRGGAAREGSLVSAPESRALPRRTRAPRSVGYRVRATWFAFGPAAVWLACAACEGGGASQPGCRFGEERVIAEGPVLELDAVALVALEVGALGLWSEPAGLFARRLDDSGAPLGAAARIGRRCAGGLSAAVAGGGVDVVCMDRGSDPSRPRAKRILPRLRWHRLDRDGRLGASRPIARVGPLSQGVAIAGSIDAAKGSGVQGAVPVRSSAASWAVWQDASVAGQTAWATRLSAEGVAPPIRLSAAGHAAGQPAVLADGRGVLAVWPETYLEAGLPRGHLVGAILAGGARTVRVASKRPLLRVHHDASRPQLLAAEALGRVLAFRDRRRKGRRTGLFLAGLPGWEGVVRAVSGAKRVARADGDARPAVCECGGRLFTATPRTYAGDYFVGLNVVGEHFDRIAPEQQFYEDAHAFSQAAAACVQGRPLLLIGERARLSQGRSKLRAVPILCEPFQQREL